MMAFLHTCATPWLSLIAGRCSIEEIHRGQQGTPSVTLPHRRDGLHVLWMAVVCPCRRPSLCCPVHCALMRSEVLDVTTIMPATPCHQRNYVEAYSRSIRCGWKERYTFQWLEGQEEAGKKTPGYCWRIQKCRNGCAPHACLEGKNAGETDARKSTSRTLN
jgi:hypothetical protein